MSGENIQVIISRVRRNMSRNADIHAVLAHVGDLESGMRQMTTTIKRLRSAAGPAPLCEDQKPLSDTKGPVNTEGKARYQRSYMSGRRAAESARPITTKDEMDPVFMKGYRSVALRARKAAARKKVPPKTVRKMRKNARS